MVTGLPLEGALSPQDVSARASRRSPTHACRGLPHVIHGSQVSLPVPTPSLVSDLGRLGHRGGERGSGRTRRGPCQGLPTPTAPRGEPAPRRGLETCATIPTGTRLPNRGRDITAGLCGGRAPRTGCDYVWRDPTNPGFQRGRGIVLGQARICPACRLPSRGVGCTLLGPQEPPGLDPRRLCGRVAKRGVEA